MAENKKSPGNKDAQFRFAMSEDGMKLGVSRYFPPNGGEGPSVELLARQVAAAGVTLPVDQDAAKKIIDSIQRDGEVKRMVLVRGIEAQEPQHSSLMALGNLDFPVFPGDRFARLHPPLHAKNGRTIDGQTLKPTQHFEPDSLEVQMGENVEFDHVEEAYVSQVWGMAKLKDGTISVEPIPHITEDEIAVKGTLHHRDFRGLAVTPARLEKEMRDMGVAIDIDSDELDRKLKQAKALDAPLLDQIVVAGSYPVPGRDGWLEYLVSTREKTGTEDESGRLDFRDKGAYPLVEAGQPIGRLHEPTAGEGGIDIYGKTIPAHGGRELFIHLGENTALLDDKITYQAKAKGIVVMEKNVLSVSDCLLIKGNVDLESGNVKVEYGSVKILGSIQAGFAVSAPKHVIVAGSVESAKVYAGGNIEIAGGILMPEGGKVRADGDVIANYATNAIIEAGNDVHIANEATNSSIQAQGKFYATQGKGIIIGGEVVTAKGMEVNEIGSELGIATTAAVLIKHEEDDGLRQEHLKIKQAIQKIDEALGDDPPEIILERTDKAKLQAVTELLKHRATLAKRRKSISESINQLILAHQEEVAGIKIKVKRFLYPGATVKFGSRGRSIKSRTEASTIYWDLESCDIVIR